MTLINTRDVTKVRGAMVECKCKSCGKPFMARVADRNRGWANFCSKSCKAIEQEQKTHQCRNYYRGLEGKPRRSTHDIAEDDLENEPFSNEEHDCNKDLD
jgi:uncharacterized cysteine cluster protein YcgN (CxxCxxCC family)